MADNFFRPEDTISPQPTAGSFFRPEDVVPTQGQPPLVSGQSDSTPHPWTIPIEAFAHGGVNMLAGLIRGVPGLMEKALLPGAVNPLMGVNLIPDSIRNPVMSRLEQPFNTVAGALDRLSQVSGLERVEEARAKPWLGEGMASKWGTEIGSVLPILAAMVALKKPIGPAGEFAAMSTMSSGSKLGELESRGISPDIARDVAAVSGPIEGALMTGGLLNVLSPWKSAAKQATERAGESFIKTLLRGPAAIAGGGAAGAGMAGASDVASNVAIGSENQRRAEQGLAPLDSIGLDQIKKDMLEGGESFAAITGLSRAAHRAVTFGSNIKAVRDYNKRALADEVTARSTIQGMSPSPIPRKVGDTAVERDQYKPLSNDELIRAVDDVPLYVPEGELVGLSNGEVVKVPKGKSGLIDIAESINKQTKGPKINLNVSEGDLRTQIKLAAGVLQEGPVPSTGKYSHLDLNKVPYSKTSKMSPDEPTLTSIAKEEGLSWRKKGEKKQPVVVSPKEIEFVDILTGERQAGGVVPEWIKVLADRMNVRLDARTTEGGKEPTWQFTLKDTGGTHIISETASPKEWVSKIQSERAKQTEKSTLKTPQEMKEEIANIPWVEHLPILDKPKTQDLARGRAVESYANKLASAVPSENKKWFDKLALAVRKNKPEEFPAIEEEAKALGITPEQVAESVVRIKANDLSGYTDMPLTISKEAAATEKRDLIHSALSPVSGIGDTLADCLIREGRKLSEVLTRTQYNQYVRNLRGQAINATRAFWGTEMARNQEVKLESVPLQKITLHDGRVFDPNSIPDEVVTGESPSMVRRYAALLPSLDQLTRLTGIRFHDLDAAMQLRHRNELRLRMSVDAKVMAYWKQVPWRMRDGLAGDRLATLSGWLINDAQGRAHVEFDELGLKPGHGKTSDQVQDMLVKRVSDSLAGGENAAKILHNAEWVAKNDRKMFDDFAEWGIITPLQFRNKYVPLIRLMKKSGQSVTDMTEFLYQNKNHPLVSRLTGKEIKTLEDMLSLTTSTDKPGAPTPGEATPFMQRERELNNAFLDDVVTIKDTRKLMEIYARRAIRKLIFQDMVPYMNWMTGELAKQSKSWDGPTTDTVDTVVSKYINSTLGIPGSLDRWARSKNLFHPINILSEKMNTMTESLRDNPLFKALPGLNWMVKEHSTSHSLPLSSATHDVFSFLYASTLGLPNNVLAPIGNIMGQLPMAAQSLGADALFSGIHKVMNADPGVISYLRSIDLRPDLGMMETPRMSDSAFRGMLNRTYKLMMLPFSLSDTIAVYGTAAGAMERWRPMEKAIKDGHIPNMNNEQVLGLLGGITSFDKSTSVAVGNGPSPLAKRVFNGHMSKPLSMEILEKIREGRVDEAKRQWVQWNVNFSQWRYGAGGQPLIFDNVVAKAVGMYKSWTMNYADYASIAARRSWGAAMQGKGGANLNRSLQVAGMWLIAGSLMASMGVPAKRILGWVGAGPISGVLNASPVVTYVNQLLSAINGAYQSAGTTIIGSEEEHQAALDAANREYAKGIKGMKRLLPVGRQP